MRQKPRSAAQKRAESKYGEKRKSKPRLPGGYLSEEEAELLDSVAKDFPSKKAAIFAGLRLLKEK